jgi:hypothetical protein
MDREDCYKIYKVFSRGEKLEILREIYEDCRLFRDLDIPVDLKIDIVEITKRILIPFNPDFLYIVKEGNVFLWTGELEKWWKWHRRSEKDPITEERFTLKRLKNEGSRITQILGKGDILHHNNYSFIYRFDKKFNIFMVSYGSCNVPIAGLPFEQDIEPVKLIRISLKETKRVFLNNKKRREIFLINFITFFGGGSYSRSFKAPQKIASALRDCFWGVEPLGWYIEESNSEIVDNGNNLKKPQGRVFSFTLKTKHLELMTGLSQPMIDSWLSKKGQKEIPFFKENGELSQYLKIEKIKGGYKFYLPSFSKHSLAHICEELEYVLYKSHIPIDYDKIKPQER